MKIIIVEDDYLQSETLMQVLEEEFPGSSITLIETESGFYNQIQSFETNLPDIVLMDIMLRWTDPSPNMTPMPEDVKNEGFYEAGFRCLKLLNSSQLAKKIPVILLSVLDKDDLESKLNNLPTQYVYIEKDEDLSLIVTTMKTLVPKRRWEVS